MDGASVIDRMNRLFTVFLFFNAKGAEETANEARGPGVGTGRARKTLSSLPSYILPGRCINFITIQTDFYRSVLTFFIKFKRLSRIKLRRTDPDNSSGN